MSGAAPGRGRSRKGSSETCPLTKPYNITSYRMSAVRNALRRGKPTLVGAAIATVTDPLNAGACALIRWGHPVARALGLCLRSL
jgi:hypothetical protein